MPGVFDLPVGGKLPPAPTYLVDGQETPVPWRFHGRFRGSDARIALFIHGKEEGRHTKANTFRHYPEFIGQ